MPSIVHQKGEGRAIWFLGELYDIRLSGEETGGELGAVEVTVPPGLPFAAPPHIHHDADETVYVLEGAARYHFEGRTVEARSGAVLHFPKGTLEWFENPGDTNLKVLIMYSPAGTERFFTEVGEPARTRTVPRPPEGPPDLARLEAIAKKYNLEVRAPPA